jgi:hypothetical protein
VRFVGIESHEIAEVIIFQIGEIGGSHLIWIWDGVASFWRWLKVRPCGYHYHGFWETQITTKFELVPPMTSSIRLAWAAFIPCIITPLSLKARWIKMACAGAFVTFCTNIRTPRVFIDKIWAFAVRISNPASVKTDKISFPNCVASPSVQSSCTATGPLIPSLNFSTRIACSSGVILLGFCLSSSFCNLACSPKFVARIASLYSCRGRLALQTLR